MDREDVDAEIERGEKTAYDVARSVLRLSGDKHVHVVCLEPRNQMPADEREIVEGEEEGITLHAGWGPKVVVEGTGKQTGKGTALRIVKCTSVFDEGGKFNPQFDESATQDIEADTVLFAVGQTSDLSFLQPGDGVESVRGLIKVDPETYQTTAPDVFACGDIAHGPRLFINAIASAQIAARSMHDWLRGTRTDVVVRHRWSPAAYTMSEGWQTRVRREPPVIEVEQRATSNAIVERPYGEAEAREQASRCLRCNINTVFDTSMCVACNGCVDVCPQNVLALVPISQLVDDPGWRRRAAQAYGYAQADFDRLGAADLDALGAVMVKDETRCIRCAMCASRCPTHAVTMQRFDFHRECVSIPAPNPRLRYAEPVAP